MTINMHNTNLNVCSLQWGLDSPLARSWTPVSPRSLLLRSRSVREFGDCRTVATIPQNLYVSVHSASLQTLWQKTKYYSNQYNERVKATKIPVEVVLEEFSLRWINLNKYTGWRTDVNQLTFIDRILMSNFRYIAIFLLSSLAYLDLDT